MAERTEHARFARSVIENYIRDGKLIKPSSAPQDLQERKAGVFVTLKIDGELRGCIGTIEPVRGTIASEISHNAIASATQDPRFPPVTVSELPRLTYSVDVLGEPEAVSGVDDLDPSRYGVIVSSRGRRGLLLPDLEGVDTAEQQVEIARNKAGIPPGAQVSLERFTVTRNV